MVLIIIMETGHISTNDSPNRNPTFSFLMSLHPSMGPILEKTSWRRGSVTWGWMFPTYLYFFPISSDWWLIKNKNNKWQKCNSSKCTWIHSNNIRTRMVSILTNNKHDIKCQWKSTNKYQTQWGTLYLRQGMYKLIQIKTPSYVKVKIN